MKLPQRHQADETLARIMVASRRTQHEVKRAGPPEGELVEYVPGGAEVAPPAEPPQPEPGAAPAGGDVPGIEESGLDMGALLGGADSFDAMLGSMGSK